MCNNLTSRNHLYLTWSGFRREVDENCALLGYYAASNGNSLPTLRDNRSVPCLTLETSVRICHYSLRNNPEKRFTYIYLHCTLACSLVDLHSAEWRIIKTNVSATVGLIFVSPSAKLQLFWPWKLPFTDPAVSISWALETKPSNTKDACFLRYDLRLVLLTYLPDYLKCQFLLTIHVSALYQETMITNYVVLSWAMR